MKHNNPNDHGKEHDNMVCSLYNESVVRRMKDILDLNGIENCMHDLKEQNRKKNIHHSQQDH